jgi:uncharacterized protein (TIGR02001 family)
MNMKALLLASAALLAVPAAASAQEVETSFNVGVTSDYVWRGVSQSDGNPALQAGFDLSSGIFYAGTWASNVDFGGDAEIEWDLYAGIKPTLGPVTFDFGILAYLYPQEDELNLWEGKAAATIASEGGASGTLAVFYSPEYGEDGPSTWYTEVSGSLPIAQQVGPFSLALAASVGFYTADENLFGLGDDYKNIRIALAGTTESGWMLEGAVTNTDLDLPGVDTADGRFVLTVKKTW